MTQFSLRRKPQILGLYLMYSNSLSIWSHFSRI